MTQPRLPHEAPEQLALLSPFVWIIRPKAAPASKELVPLGKPTRWLGAERLQVHRERGRDRDTLSSTSRHLPSRGTPTGRAGLFSS